MWVEAVVAELLSRPEAERDDEWQDDLRRAVEAVAGLTENVYLTVDIDGLRLHGHLLHLRRARLGGPLRCRMRW